MVPSSWLISGKLALNIELAVFLKVRRKHPGIIELAYFWKVRLKHPGTVELADFWKYGFNY